MEKEMKKVYETPWMECMQIESEGDFMAASIIKEPTGNGTTITADSQDFVDINASSSFNEKGDQTYGSTITWE